MGVPGAGRRKGWGAGSRGKEGGLRRTSSPLPHTRTPSDTPSPGGEPV